MNDIKYLTVSAITKYIKHILENNQHLTKIYLKGEISNLTKHSRGHFYFTLKDDYSQIRVVMFNNYASKVSFNLKDGDKVMVMGQISVYEAGGSYSLNAYTVDLDGIGDLYLAYEKMKKELQSKGYFDESRKKALPKYPKVIGVVTSPTGAAIKDIIHTIERRYPIAEVLLYPALVQGPDAKNSISKQINKANSDNLVDVLIIGRGGGSIEDLWGFNELLVIESIINSKIPIISGVGHETDFTISDFVSDLRAPTPTAAAELATPSKDEIMIHLKNQQTKLLKSIEQIIKELKLRLLHAEERLEQTSPVSLIKHSKEKHFKLSQDLTKNYLWLISSKKQHYTYLNDRIKSFDMSSLIKYKLEKIDRNNQDLQKNMADILLAKSNQFASLKDQLKLLNPLNYMDKGYSISTINDVRISSVDEVIIDSEIKTMLKDGLITSRVIKKEKNNG